MNHMDKDKLKEVLEGLYGKSLMITQDWSTEEIEAAERLLEEAAKMAEEKGVRAEKRLLIRGNEPWEDIIEVSKEVDAKMIVMGRGIVKTEVPGELVLSRNTERVVLLADRPVLLV